MFESSRKETRPEHSYKIYQKNAFGSILGQSNQKMFKINKLQRATSSPFARRSEIRWTQSTEDREGEIRSLS